MATETTRDTPLIRALRALNRGDLVAEMREIERQQTELEIHKSLVGLALRLKETETEARGPSRAPKTQGRQRRRGSNGGRPTLRVALMMIMAERAGVWMKNDLMDSLDEHGWMPKGSFPRNQVGNRLLEMIERGEVMRVGKGFALVATRKDSGPVGTLLGAGDKSPS